MSMPTELFTITELATEFDITPRAIRFYETVGLLAPDRAGRSTRPLAVPILWRSFTWFGS